MTDMSSQHSHHTKGIILMKTTITLSRIGIITACIVLFGALLTDGDLVKLTLFIQIITLLILSLALCKLFKITDPIAVGVAIGTSSHAIGTSKALEIGQIEGAMSSLSIVVAGLLTVIGAPIFAGFIR